MKTKDKIVERLLKEESITIEEAVVLLKEKQQIGFQQFPPAPIVTTQLVPYHTICGCDVCNCTIGNRLVYPSSSGNYITDNTFTTSHEEKN